MRINSKIICTTSDHYHPVLYVFCYLFNHFWNSNQEVTVLGFKQPTKELPNNFKFISLGSQRGLRHWANDLREYLVGIEDENILLTMEDTFLKAPVNFYTLKALESCMNSEIIRADLTWLMSQFVPNEPFKQVDNINILKSRVNADWKISLQVSIWNRLNLISYLTSDYNPWDFEQRGKERAKKDSKLTIGTKDSIALLHNEGTRVQFKDHLNLEGMPFEVIEEMIDLGLVRRSSTPKRAGDLIFNYIC